MLERRFTDPEVYAIRLDPRVSTVVAELRGCHESLIRQIRGGFIYETSPWPPLEHTPIHEKANRRGKNEDDRTNGALLWDPAVLWLRWDKEQYPETTYDELAELTAEMWHLDHVPSAQAISNADRRESWRNLK